MQDWLITGWKGQAVDSVTQYFSTWVLHGELTSTGSTIDDHLHLLDVCGSVRCSG